MTAKNTWVVMGGRSNELGHCTRCGEGLVVQLPLRVATAAALIKAFVRAHGGCPPGTFHEPLATTPEQWLLGRDTGTSSRTIYAAIQHATIDRAGVPLDPGDFGRCYRLLKLFPTWRKCLGKVATRFPEWKPLVDNWAELERLYEEELPKGNAPRLYDRMQQLIAK